MEYVILKYFLEFTPILLAIKLIVWLLVSPVRKLFRFA